MSKHATFLEYPARGLAAAESALLTLWPTLKRYHGELVLVGGLAVHFLTRRTPSTWPGTVTMDVDFGIELSAGEGAYSLLEDLAGIGFCVAEPKCNRLVRRVHDMALYVDFLTESPPAITGSRMVDDVVASIVPGINRALASRRMITISGLDVFGVEQKCKVAVADIGPLLVLKLNAFGGPIGRRHPKDAYDVLLAVTSFIDGPTAAISAFHDEERTGNTGYETAIEALRRDFVEIGSAGPVRAAEFVRGTVEDQKRVREELASAARFLLGE
jgi:hypothetical protein